MWLKVSVQFRVRYSHSSLKTYSYRTLGFVYIWQRTHISTYTVIGSWLTDVPQTEHPPFPSCKMSKSQFSEQWSQFCRLKVNSFDQFGMLKPPVEQNPEIRPLMSLWDVGYWRPCKILQTSALFETTTRFLVGIISHSLYSCVQKHHQPQPSCKSYSSTNSITFPLEFKCIQLVKMFLFLILQQSLSHIVEMLQLPEQRSDNLSVEISVFPSSGSVCPEPPKHQIPGLCWKSLQAKTSIRSTEWRWKNVIAQI